MGWGERCGVVLLLALVTVLLTTASGHFLNHFTVSVKGGQAEVDYLASALGFKVVRELPHIGAFILSHPTVQHRSRRSADHLVSSLLSHPLVKHAQQETELVREKREIVYDKQLEFPIRTITDNSVYFRSESRRLVAKDDIPGGVLDFNDPCYHDQWYINNEGQSGGRVDLDLNVRVAWQQGFTGTGVTICILDDGIDHTHPDLIHSFDPEASTDLNDLQDKDQDPMPNKTDIHNSHGTRCAGEITAAPNNNVCGVGIAYTARIGGVRLLDGPITDALEGEALLFKSNHVDIYSASWGPKDDGKTMEEPKYYAKQALEKGVKEGRNGRGNIYVWATGNGGFMGDDCNADGYASSVHTLSVGSITDKGRRPYFTENCTSTLAVVPSGGEEVRGEESRRNITKLKVVTTDLDGGCIENFQGTSSAAPLAAGCMALVLQARPELTWRDAQHVVVRGSHLPSVDHSWVMNGANHHVSPSFGFGVMDCGEMVQIAQNWNLVPPQHICRHTRHGVNRAIPQGSYLKLKIQSDGCHGNNEEQIDRLEHVQVKIRAQHSRRGDLQLFLTSPLGTRSQLLSPRPNDNFDGEIEHTFMTVHSWDEVAHGTWTLEVHDNPGSSGRKNFGFLYDWELVLYGTQGRRDDRASFSNHHDARAYVPEEERLEKIMEEETKSSKRVQIRRASEVTDKRVNTAAKTKANTVHSLRSRLDEALQEILGKRFLQDSVKELAESEQTGQTGDKILQQSVVEGDALDSLPDSRHHTKTQSKAVTHASRRNLAAEAASDFDAKERAKMIKDVDALIELLEKKWKL